MQNVTNQCNHRLLLWLALEMTKEGAGKVVEFGSGHGSTPFLREYCEDAGRKFESYDNHPQWAAQTGAQLIEVWDNVDASKAAVLFIDHAPGERRKIDIAKYKDLAVIIVAHDTEPAADHGYMMRQHFDHFKYVAEIKGAKEMQGAWATVMSNFLDVRAMIGEEYGPYKVRGFQGQIEKA